MCVIRTPNRGVVVAGAALGSVGLVVGVLGGTSAMASAKPATAATTVTVPATAATTVTVAPNTGSAVESAAESRQIAAERSSLSAQAAAVAAVAGAAATAPPKPKPKKKAKASRAKKRAPLTPREMAQQLVSEHKGWKPAQFTCLDKLWTRESGWNPHNQNGGSGAYGIPQSLPARKMAAFGSDWRDNPMTQIRWGLWYIADRYQTPCAAWEHSQRYNYY
jgi:hypothetical protein